MGLFSSIGKVLKGVAKVAGIIPGVGGTISKIAGGVGGLLDHKKPMGTAAGKAIAVLKLGPNAARGNATQGWSQVMQNAQQMRASPVMPGGAVASSSGMAPRQANPPRSFGGSRSGTTRKRKRTSARNTYYSRTRKKASKSRLKFGSKAWQAKYNPRSKRKRR